METYSPDDLTKAQEILNGLNDHYGVEFETGISEWMEVVQNELSTWMKYPDKRIHSVRARVKDKGHRIDKVARKISKIRRSKGKKQELSSDNFFDRINDFAGCRVLVLYRHDIAIVDHVVYSSDAWRVLRSTAKCSREEDLEFYKSLGFSTQKPKRSLKTEVDGYSSVHYILTKPNKCEPYEICELQVRTIHEEAWGEFSHQFVYPHSSDVDPLARSLIGRLSGLLHQAEDIASDIRKSPADASLFRAVHKQLWNIVPPSDPTEQAKHPQGTFNVIHEMLARTQFMEQSALFAAVGILTEHENPESNQMMHAGKPVEATDVVTLHFYDGTRANVDEVKKLYFSAQETWKRADGSRNVSKFLVPMNGRTKVSIPREVREYNDIQFYLLSYAAFKEIVKVLDKAADKRYVGYSLEYTQFLIWKSKNGEAESARLPYTIRDEPRETVGFYSPCPDPDVLAGIVWLKQPANQGISKTLHAYADILLRLTDYESLITPLTGDTATIPPRENTLCHEEKRTIRRVISETFTQRGSSRTSG